MKKLICVLMLLCFILASCTAVGDVSSPGNTSQTEPDSPVFITLSEEELQDKVLGSWVGQMAGVVYGADLEYHYTGSLIPADKIPDFATLDINNALWQDDLYVEITFVNEMLRSGWDCSLGKLGRAFALSQYGLDHANKQGRENLRNGIKAELAGSYLYNTHCDDIDWQIDSDFVGTIYAGLPQEAANRAFEIGHLMNYGDGVYGGVFVSAMHASAFTAASVAEVIQAGFDAIPDGTKFKDTINDVKKLYDEGKTWEECWQFLEDNWAYTDRCLGGCNIAFNIDAKLNAAYVLMGLLWGEGDFDRSMVISQRCGQDSDCNPSTVGGILGNFYGYKAIPEVFKSKLKFDGDDFYSTGKNLKEIVESSLKLTRDMYTSRGFTLSESDVWMIPETKKVEPVEFEQWPDIPSVVANATVNGSEVILSVSTSSGVGIDTYECDMGDGTVFDTLVAVYSYSEAGDYTVKCTVTDKNGETAFAEVKVTIGESGEIDRGDYGTVRNIAPFSAITVSDTAPTGGGSKDANVIRDGNKSFGATFQYDTYIGYCARHTDYIGYLFNCEFDVTKLVYTEGIHYDNGGWFADSSMILEVLIDGKWVKPEYTCTPDYPNGNTREVFEPSIQAYTFILDNISCKGIRLSGIAGGDAGFINCTELEVFAVETEANK